MESQCLLGVRKAASQSSSEQMPWDSTSGSYPDPAAYHLCSSDKRSDLSLIYEMWTIIGPTPYAVKKIEWDLTTRHDPG